MKMNRRYLIMLAAAVTAASCGQAELDCPEGGTSAGASVPANGFIAGFEGADTKVTLQSDYSLHWDKDDEVAVWNGTSYSRYIADQSGESVTILGDDTSAELNYCAFYPYADDLEFDGTNVTATIPNVQTPVKGNFPYNPSVAYTAGKEKAFCFFNVCGLIGFEITAENISNVVIYSGNGEPLTGKVTVDCTSMAPSATVVDGKDHVILQTVDSEGAAGVFEPGQYYVSVLPNTFEKGLTVTMNTADGFQEKKIKTTSFTLNRSHRINASTIDADAVWDNNEITNAAELQAFLNVAANCAETSVATLANDIDMQGFSLVPAASFAGKFDGNGKTIKNWETNTALFNTLTGVVQNLTVGVADADDAEGVEQTVLWINEKDDAAFIALNNEGVISNCTTNGVAKTRDGLTFEVERAVGAIAARSTGTIENCINNASITLAPASVENCSESEVKAGDYEGLQFVGGIVGRVSGTDGSAKIKDCRNAGAVSYTSESYIGSMSCVGGILGGTPATTYSAVADWTPVNNVVISGCQNLSTAKITWGYKTNAAANAYNNIVMGGVAGYLEGEMSGSSNAAVLKVDGYRTTDDQAGDFYVKNVSVAGVAGVVTGDVSDCDNTGKIDFSATISGGDTSAGYIGSTGHAAVAGVVAKTNASATVSGCENSGEMVVDLHMRQSNGSTGDIGGVVGFAYNSIIKDCTNKGNCTWTPRTCVQNLGGVCGYYYINAVPYNCNNSGSITCSAGDIVENAGRQSASIRLGGVFGRLEGNVNITGKQAFTNTGDITYSGGSNLSNNNADSEYKYIGGVIGMVKATGTAMSVRGSETERFVNSGKITISSVDAACHVAGIIGFYDADNSKSTDAVDFNCSTNNGPIEIQASSKDVTVGGIIGYYNYGCGYGSVNTAKIKIANGGGTVRVGGVVGNLGGGKRMVGMTNSGDIEVTTTSAEGTVYIGGIRGGDNGQINSAYEPCLNSGNITLTTNAATSFIGGVAPRDGATRVYASSTGNIAYTYTGTAVPKVYAALGLGYRGGATALYSGTYGGTLTISGVSDQSECYYGVLGGFIKSGCGVSNASVISINKSTVINGVQVSDKDADDGYYLSTSYLIGAKSAGTVETTQITLL